MARPRKFTSEQVIAALKKTRGLISVAARELSCSHATVLNYIRTDPAVAEAYQEIVEAVGDALEAALLDEALNKRNVGAIIFYLKSKYKNRGFSTRVETTGVDGGPIILDVTKMSDEELRRIVGDESGGGTGAAPAETDRAIVFTTTED